VGQSLSRQWLRRALAKDRPEPVGARQLAAETGLKHCQGAGPALCNRQHAPVAQLDRVLPSEGRNLYLFELKMSQNYKELLKATLFDPMLSQHHVSTDLRKVSQAV
jgi:hypothetical protein